MKLFLLTAAVWLTGVGMFYGLGWLLDNGYGHAIFVPTVVVLSMFVAFTLAKASVIGWSIGRRKP